MIKVLLFIIQIIFIIIVISWIVLSRQTIDFYWNGLIFSSNTGIIFGALVIIVAISLFFQRLYLYLRNSPKRIKTRLKEKNFEKGINAIVKAMAAISNNDQKEVVFQSKKIEQYLKNNSISLIIKAESAKRSKKFIVAEENYNKMLSNEDTKILGLRGLLEQNLKSQDYHHALIYAEQIYNINSKLDWIYKTILEIMIKTKNWQKLIYINNDAQKKKIISQNKKSQYNAIAKYEIALIKEQASIREALDLLKEANRERPNFPPIAKKLVSLLIQNNEIAKAKKVLATSWYNFPHQILFEEIIKIAEVSNINIVNYVNKLTSSKSNEYESIIAKTKANIIEKKWDEAKNLLKTILTSRPNKTICVLMSEIELGISGNSQKANSWISRSNLGEPEKSWICKEYGSIQDNWASININGLFDTLEWTWPKNNFNDNSKEISNAIPDIIGTR